jgi:uncharacterized membrane protein
MGQPHHRGIESTAAVARHPLHPMLVPLPIAAFIFALVADIAWLRTGRPFWGEASYWLLLSGVITGLIAAIPGIVDYMASERVRNLPTARLHGALNTLALLLGLINLLLRGGQGATPIFGIGIILSFATVAVLGVSGWLGGELSYRHGVGVMAQGADALPDDRPAVRPRL